MNKSWQRDIGNASVTAFFNQKSVNPPDFTEMGFQEQSKSIEAILVSPKRKEMLKLSTNNTINLQSNLRRPKKYLQLSPNKRIANSNESIVLKPKNMFFPRLNTEGHQQDDKQITMEKPKSSKGSIHRRRILSNSHSLRARKKKYSHLNGFTSNHQQNKLQKIAINGVFLVSLPKHKRSCVENQPNNEQKQSRNIHIKRSGSQMFSEDRSKYIFMLGHKKSKP